MGDKHPVSMLQEIMARQQKALPAYEMSDLSTRECPRFRCTVKVDGIKVFADATQKQAAKKQAAMNALLQLGHININNMAVSSKDENIPITTVSYNAVGHLNEYAAKNRLLYPTYNECGYNITAGFTISCTLADRSTEGTAPTKKAAKQVSAHHMLQSLQNLTLTAVPKPPPMSKTDVISDNTIITRFRQLSTNSLTIIPEAKVKIEEEEKVCYENNESLQSNNSSNRKDPAIASTTAMIEELKKYNVSYSIDIVTRNPLVLSLKIKNSNNLSFVETGETYQEAQENLLRKALKVISTLEVPA
ncbi:hypothetical protein Trydic_g22809 [Trypoxylus dichotomus]